jgi:hypothetical protein
MILVAEAASLDRLAIDSLAYETDPRIRKIGEVIKNLDARIEGINAEIEALHRQISSLKKNP